MNRPRRCETVDLPAPDAAARSHSLRLSDLIRSEIDAAGGFIGFRHYMDLALYAPGLGYYSAGSAKLGPSWTSRIWWPEMSMSWSFSGFSGPTLRKRSLENLLSDTSQRPSASFVSPMVVWL